MAVAFIDQIPAMAASIIGVVGHFALDAIQFAFMVST